MTEQITSAMGAYTQGLGLMGVGVRHTHSGGRERNHPGVRCPEETKARGEPDFPCCANNEELLWVITVITHLHTKCITYLHNVQGALHKCFRILDHSPMRWVLPLSLF